MPYAPERLEFAPPKPPGQPQAVALAVLAHALLLVALTWGVQWDRKSESVVAEAELWSAVPQQAAPPAAVAPPTPPPPPPVAERTPPPPPPVPERRDADIALEREKERQAQERKQRELQAQQEERERQQKLAAQKKAEADKRLAEQKRQDAIKQAQAEKDAERRKLEQQQQQAAAAKAKAREAEEAKRLAELREQNLKRLQGLAGGTGSTEGASAARASGPSASYAGRVQARVKPNIVFGEDLPGNPSAVVEVRLAPDGTITSRRVVKSSGVRSWDEAVLRALDRTEVLPRDVDGRVPSPLEIEFRPKG